jgi:hypothetical protein
MNFWLLAAEARRRSLPGLDSSVPEPVLESRGNDVDELKVQR